MPRKASKPVTHARMELVFVLVLFTLAAIGLMVAASVVSGKWQQFQRLLP